MYQIYDKETIKMLKERGIYTNPDESSFKSDREVKRELALEGRLPEIQFNTPLKVPLSIDYYLQRASERSKSMKEQNPKSENFIEMSLPETSLVSVWGDLHMGAVETDNERIQQELNTILNTPNSYLIFLGDLVEGIFWGGASGSEQSQTLDEQRMFLNSLFTAVRGKVLFAIGGEHDQKWASKVSGSPYLNFTERTKAPYIRGVAEVEINIGEQKYKLVAQHQARGSSMYNKNHPTFREARFELQDADIYLSAHTHKKQISQETIRKFGRSDIVTHISTGTYKKADNYGDMMGYPHQLAKEMYGASIILHKDKKLVEVNYDILEMHKLFEKFE